MNKYSRTLFFLLLLLLTAGLCAACGDSGDATKNATLGTAADSAAKDAAKSGGSGAAPRLPAAITGVNIADPAVLARQKPLLATFAQDMVEQKALNADVAQEDLPFVLVPPLPGKGRWLTPKSFAFTVSEDFAPGTSYSLFFKEDLKSLDGRPARYVVSFRTRGVELSAVQPGVYDPQAHTLALHLDFSEPVSGEALAEHLRISDAASGEALKLDFPQKSERSGNQTVIAHLGAFRPALTFELRADQKGDARPLGLASARVLTVNPPAPGSDGLARISGNNDAPSPISLFTPYFGEDEEGRQQAWVTMSEALLDQQQKDFIVVSPDLPYSADRWGSSLIFSKGLTPGTTLTVTLKAGLSDSSGRVLKEDRSVSALVPDYESAARFAEPGNFLTPLFGSRVAVNLVNVDQVNVSLRRQYENNLPFMTLPPDSRGLDMMREIAMKEIRITGLARNEVQRRALDLQSLADGKRGVFLLSLESFRNVRDESRGIAELRYSGERQRLVVLTDIGVSARLFPSGITVLATDLTSARPLKDAAVKVYSNSNQLVARGYTDGDGLFIHKRAEKWDGQLEPAVVVVESGEGDNADMTFLPLNGATGLREEDTALRAYLDQGCEAFVYTPRGVFRPGERVEVKAFVRDERHEAPEPFPVLFRIVSSRGQEMARAPVTLSEQGGADFAFSLPTSAPSGAYIALVEIPGREDQALGRCEFSVEDFTPPRLEVSLVPQGDVIIQGGSLNADLSGRYLFGAPGAGLNYEFGYRAVRDLFSPQGFEGFTFGDGERDFSASSNLSFMTGSLPDSGAATLQFSPPADWAEAMSVLNIQLVASVQEDGGRWVSHGAAVRYFPGSRVLGLKTRGESFRAGGKVGLDVAAVDPQGKSVDAGELTAEVSEIQGNWHTVYRNGRYVYTYDERLIPRQRPDLVMKDGRGLLEFTPDRPGSFLVRVRDRQGLSASRRVFVSGADGAPLAEGTGRMDKVELALDKAAYRAGETAKLTVRAPFAGSLLLGLERGAQISARVLTLESPGTVIDIPVTEGMDPNIRITASVIRPLREDEREWHSHRAFGAVSLALAKEPFSLKVSPAAPERALPGKPLSVPFTVVDEQGAPVQGEFSVALVDEGILSLTGFATPRPLDLFLAPRRASGRSHDAFDALLRPEAKATPLLRPGGDMMMAAAYQGSLSTQPVTLAAFAPVVKSDAHGRGEALFDVPEYSGKGRIMIVGASGRRFASAESHVRFARDVELEASAPRVAAPGDIFDVSLRLFTAPEGASPLEGLAEISLAAEGPLVIEGAKAFSLPLGAKPGTATSGAATSGTATSGAAAPGKDGADKNGAGKGGSETAKPETDGADKEKSAPEAARSLSVKVRAGDAPGLAQLRLSVSVPGREDLRFEKSLQIAVRPPYARSAVGVQALVRAGETAELQLPGRWSPGAFAPSLSVGPSPAAALPPLLNFLADYPYGCLEQLVSRAWPHAVLPRMRASLAGAETPASGNTASGNTASGNTAAEENNSLAMLSQYVGSIAALQRPGGGFAVWPDRDQPDPWRSVYAIWLLNEIKDRVPMPGGLREAGADYLRFLLAAPVEALARTQEEALTVKAFAAMVLTRSGEAPLGWLQHLAGLQDKMLPSGRICLAGAMALHAGNASALKALDAQSLSMDARSLSLDGPAGSNATLESDLRNKSLLLWLWSQVEPQADACRQLCLEIVERLGRREWHGPHQSALAVLAVASWVEMSGYGGGEYKAGISAGGKPLAEAENGAELILDADRLPAPDAGGLMPPLVISLEGTGSAYAVLSARGTPLEAPEPASNGLSISRVWKKPDGTVIDLSSGQVTLQRGDRVLAELEVRAARPVSDIVLSDLLPGGLEVENPRLNTPARDENAEEPSGLFVDQREDRMLLFFDGNGGAMKYTYSLRAVSRGSFVLPPLAADAMYEPGLNAVTGSGRVVVE